MAEYLRELDSGAMLVFVHRDAESESLEVRLSEFEAVDREDVVPVVPVRMTEAWLLIDPRAIAIAADRPQAAVEVPRPRDLERLTDPKETLERLLFEAAGNPSGRRGKRLKTSLASRRILVAELITDYSLLEQLPAFRRFQESLAARYPYHG